MKSLIYYSFIAGFINFISVMKDVEQEGREVKEGLSFYHMLYIQKEQILS